MCINDITGDSGYVGCGCCACSARAYDPLRDTAYGSRGFPVHATPASGSMTKAVATRDDTVRNTLHSECYDQAGLRAKLDALMCHPLMKLKFDAREPF